MNYGNTNTKTGHPILGVLLGVAGILVAVLLTFVAGVVAGGVAALLGLLAVLLGVAARKSGKGIGAILTGALAILLAIAMTVSITNVYKEIKDNAAAKEETQFLVQYLDKPYLGLAGLLMSVPQDEASLAELVEKINALR